MNPITVGKLLRVIADLNATVIGVHDGLDPILVMNDLDQVEQTLQELRLKLFRGQVEYDRAE